MGLSTSLKKAVVMDFLRLAPTPLSLFLLSFSADAIPIHETLLQCLQYHFPGHTNMPQLLYYPNTTAYTSLLQSSVRNLRFLSSPFTKPLLIIAPRHESHIQASIICCKKHGVHMTIRSGGHDYEGLSYLSHYPFVILDLLNFRSISIDMEDETAWVESGATLGELSYKIAKASRVHGFPAGLCHTVAVGGHFSGGGIGNLVRKYGLSADNILDARLVDSHGRVLNRKSMGEDMFWAIRGGGAASFAVILSWKIKLVSVPPIVTVFNIEKTLKQGAAELVDKWQHIADKLHENLSLRVSLETLIERTRKKFRVLFRGFFLGNVDELLPMMLESFPELGLKPEDCLEMSWLESNVYYAGFPFGSSPEVLLNDLSAVYRTSFKARFDFVQDPIPEDGLERVWKMLQEEVSGNITLDPMGGRMNGIEESAIPFPHRTGNLYNMQYIVSWQDEKDAEVNLNWIKRIYDEMGPYVSKYPRGAYVNARDLDLGKNEAGATSYSTAKAWGMKYFKNNFRKLAKVKGTVDKDNFFRNEQSIPPLTTS